MSNTPVIRFKKLDERACVPTRGSEASAGADLRAVLDGPVSIAPGETYFVHTGLAMEIPYGYVGLICARSSLGTKRGLAPANKVGVIDSDYRGEIMMALHNHSQKEAVIEPGERVAQLLIVPVMLAEFEEADILDETARGSGGFGSTGKM